uniref:Uncharacterized protein n=1 Tax=viral metagenome TaxID=1070528 RepID=A0A6C0H7N9_9ZZZZ
MLYPALQHKAQSKIYYNIESESLITIPLEIKSNNKLEQSYILENNINIKSDNYYTPKDIKYFINYQKNEQYEIQNMTFYEKEIIKSFKKFYEDEKNINLFLSILSKEYNISIRLVIFFILRYSKLNKINYIIHKNDNTKYIFNVYFSYKQQIKNYQIKFFDPFNRGNKISYLFNNNQSIITTIGQMNFFKWFIENDIYDYLIDNYELIYYEMMEYNKNDRIKKKDIIKIKNKHYKYNMINNNHKHNYDKLHPIIVSFSF